MTFPPSWNKVNVYGTFLDGSGDPASGWVRFDMLQPVTVASQVVDPTSLWAFLDSTGSISIDIPATDDPDISPTGWAWRVTEYVAGSLTSFFLQVPVAGGPIDIVTAAPAVDTAQFGSLAEVAFTGSYNNLKDTPNTATYTSVYQYATLAMFPNPGQPAKLYIAADTGKLYRWNGTAYVSAGGGGAGTFVLNLGASPQSTFTDATSKRLLGATYFDPNDLTWGLSATSTATLYMLNETQNAGYPAGGDLLDMTTPAVVASVPTVTALTATLVSVDVSTRFRPGQAAANFTARLWATVSNNVVNVTNSAAWIEISP